MILEPLGVRCMHAARLSLATVGLLAVLGCSAPAPEQDKEAAEALGRDTDETVFDDMIQTQDKARAVEDLTLGRKDELDQALEASEGDDPADE
jgi:hypothetical protein